MANPQAVADALRDARKAFRPLATFPGSLPRTLAAAYSIQERQVNALGGALPGWKVGTIAPELQEALGDERFCGPVSRLYDQRNSASQARVRVIAGGFAAVEAELILKMGRALPIRSAPYSASELVDAVEALHIGVEIAGSPLLDITHLGALGAVSDHGNNLAIVVGPAVANWDEAALEGMRVSVRIGTTLVGEGGSDRVPGGVAAALGFLVRHLATRGRSLKPGDWVSTGAMTGVHPIDLGQSAHVTFGTAGSIALWIHSDG